MLRTITISYLDLFYIIFRATNALERKMMAVLECVCVCVFCCLFFVSLLSAFVTNCSLIIWFCFNQHLVLRVLAVASSLILLFFSWLVHSSIKIIIAVDFILSPFSLFR